MAFATVFLATVFLAGAFLAIALAAGEVDLAGIAFLSSLPIIFCKNAGSAMVILLLVGDVRIVHMVFTTVKLFSHQTIARIERSLARLAPLDAFRSNGPYDGS